jgi:hypothetical protein
MLLPVLSKAKLRAQSIKCTANLKQLTTAAFMYQNDYGPIGYNVGGNTVWLNVLASYYAQVDGVRVCPLAQTPVNAAGTGYQVGTADHCWAYTSGAPNTTNEGSYTLNGWLYDPNSGNPTASSFAPNTTGFFRKDTAIRFPSGTPVFGDGVYVDDFAQNTDQPYFATPGRANLYLGANGLGDGTIRRYLIARHGSSSPATAPTAYNYLGSLYIPYSMNLSFADAHVETVKLSNLWQYYWSLNSVPGPMP